MFNKNRTFPIILTLIIIIIIIYLFATLKQPYVECSKTTTDQFDIKIEERIKTTFNGNKISKINLTKTITLPDKYNSDKYLESIKSSLEKSYKYLNNKVNIKKVENGIITTININNKETIILNNIEFINMDDLEIKINSNTKSSDVITLKINDKYTEGEFKTHLKNNGYVCK